MRKHLLILGCWTFLTVFFAVHMAIGSRALGQPESFFRALLVYGTCNVFWFAMTMPIVRLSRRFRLAGAHPLRNALLHLGLSIVFTIGSFSSFIVISPLVGLEPEYHGFLTRLTRLIAFDLHLEMLRYWAIVAIEHAINYHRQVREREVALAQAKLEVLKRQLQPHFLFNTLNSISVLMFENVTLANRMLLRLSELLRAGLTNDSPHEVSLERELAFLERYLDIERIRFGERLTVDVDIEETTLGARVPNLILQPIVENAIKYGVAAIDRPSTVSITAKKEGGELVLRVRDDGPGIPRDAKRGVGLTNTEARLRQLYGEEQKLELTSSINGGVLVSIAIPFRPCVS